MEDKNKEKNLEVVERKKESRRNLSPGNKSHNQFGLLSNVAEEAQESVDISPSDIKQGKGAAVGELDEDLDIPDGGEICPSQLIFAPSLPVLFSKDLLSRAQSRDAPK